MDLCLHREAFRVHGGKAELCLTGEPLKQAEQGFLIQDVFGQISYISPFYSLD